MALRDRAVAVERLQQQVMLSRRQGHGHLRNTGRKGDVLGVGLEGGSGLQRRAVDQQHEMRAARTAIAAGIEARALGRAAIVAVAGGASMVMPVPSAGPRGPPPPGKPMRTVNS